MTASPIGHDGLGEITRAAPASAPPRWVLATDLDGTFLAGDEAQRARLAEVLATQDALLIFVTGRGLETVRPLLADPSVPRPRYVIADVGATVWDVAGQCPLQPLQAELEAPWPGEQTVLEALSAFSGLARQEVPQERRCSFYAEAGQVSPDLQRVVKALGCELLFSADRYLDVLPAGVSKGSTLQALLRHLGISERRVLVAGDTLNDLSLFRTGIHGVAVGGAERGLVDAVRDLENTLVADAPGAGGILQGLLHHGLVPADLASPDPRPTAAEGAQLVMVYHRLPFEEVRRGGKLQRRRPKSPNGIIPSLLQLFSDGRAGSWIAWSLQASRDPEGFEPVVDVDPEGYPNLTAARVPLTKDDVNLFYKRFSKEAFWPVIFSFPGQAVFNHEHWAHYLEINRAFAEATARQARPGATVWIHDYNLWMVPAFLRRLRPDVKIAFFHHTAFPASDIFNIIPWRAEIVGSLLQCDYVGFHIPRYAENFVDVARSNFPARVTGKLPCAPRFATYGCALGVEHVPVALQTEERTVRLGVHPVGVDVEKIERIVTQPETRERIEAIRGELGSRKCLLSVERLDYVKGPLQKIEAFEALLEAHPELHGNVVMLNIVTPPADGMEIYRSVGEKVNQAIGRVNGRFGRIDWTPMQYFLRSLPFEEVVAYYAAADIAWITPLRDGLNLVAKEYVAAQAAVGGTGALLLSEFAGAAVELQGAVLANPFDKKSMLDSLRYALGMATPERTQRLRRLADIVRRNDVRTWGAEFLERVESEEA
ncbi:MAG: glucosylglycerol-phosphate synthase [Myxococcales bacterium]|nr:glucosylglycerol-phosphate synthase [Myxococcales bacterium]